MIPEGNANEKPVLLVIDDSPAIHRLLAVKLRDEDLEFMTAYSGMEGLDIAENALPSLILLDLMMPEMNGLETLRRLKGSRRTMRIPVVMLSGESDSEQKVKCFSLGAMDFVTKPFDVAELRARIQSAIRLTTLMTMLEQRAQIDALTGLWNRARFDQALASEINEASRRDQSLALVIADLDHFKKLNDTFGHQAGDAAISTFATILQAQVRSYDVACRYGGEEFGLIFPGTSLDDAHDICERIRQTVEAHTWIKYPGMRVTASFGVTGTGAEGNEPEHWLRAADQALYAAKEAGRNRVLRYAPDAGSSGDGDPHAYRLAG